MIFLFICGNCICLKSTESDTNTHIPFFYLIDVYMIFFFTVLLSTCLYHYIGSKLFVHTVQAGYIF